MSSLTKKCSACNTAYSFYRWMRLAMRRVVRQAFCKHRYGYNRLLIAAGCGVLIEVICEDCRRRLRSRSIVEV